jgi:hypothetical protein
MRLDEFNALVDGMNSDAKARARSGRATGTAPGVRREPVMS